MKKGRREPRPGWDKLTAKGKAGARKRAQEKAAAALSPAEKTTPATTFKPPPRPPPGKEPQVVPVPPEVPTKAQERARSVAVVCADHSKHTCLELRREPDPGDGTGKVVVFIPLSDAGFHIQRLPAPEFDHQYREIEYPVERAARKYVDFAQELGGSPEALAELATLITVTEKEKHMAAAKQRKPGIATATANARIATATRTGAPLPAGRQPPRATKTLPAAAAARKNGATRRTFASACREMLMEKGADGRCRQTRDQIFAKLKAEFKCADKCRPHVDWYYGQLKREYKQTPPAPRT